MKVRLFAPLFAIAVVVLMVVGISFGATAATETALTDYLIKPLEKERVLYVQPKLSAFLKPGTPFSLAPEALLSALTEIEQNYTISSTNLHTRSFKGLEIPGLFVFVNPLIGQQEQGTEAIASSDLSN